MNRLLEILPVNRRTLLVVVAAMMLLALPPIAGAMDEVYLITLFSRILIYALAAVSLDLMLGLGGMVSLGHAAFFGIGAYVVCIFSFHSMEGLPIVSWPFTVAGSENGCSSGRWLWSWPPFRRRLSAP